MTSESILTVPPKAVQAEVTIDKLLPAWLQPFVSAVSDRHQCPAESVALFCLAGVGSAAGNSAQLEVGPGASHVAPNLHLLVSGRQSGLGGALSDVLFPLDYSQRNGVNLLNGVGSSKLMAEIASSERLRDDFLRNSRFPEPNHLQVYESKIIRLRQASKPLLMLYEPSIEEVWVGLQRSQDEALLLVESNGMGDLGDDDWTPVLRHGWARKTIVRSVDEEEILLAEPCISIVCISDSETLPKYLMDKEMLSSGVMQQFLIIADRGGNSSKTVDNPVFDSRDSAVGWKNLITGLLEARAAKRFLYRTSAEALKILSKASQEVTDMIGEAEDPLRDLARNWRDNTLRVMLALHLIQDREAPLISESTGQAAVAITLELTRRQISYLSSLSIPLDTREQEMLTKIREKGRIKPRDLYRTYHIQLRHHHEPVITRLILAGYVRREPDGCLIPIKNDDDYSGQTTPNIVIS